MATDSQPGLINGQEPGSEAEWRTAVGLWANGWTFDYQVSLLGGRIFRGGTIVDFIVHTRPKPTPLYVDGDYWHGSATKREQDRLKRESLIARLGGVYAVPVTFLGSEVETDELAKRKVRQEFGRA